jgi:hypothetical protein
MPAPVFCGYLLLDRRQAKAKPLFVLHDQRDRPGAGSPGSDDGQGGSGFEVL